MRDPYTVLGVSRSVSEKDLKSAYRKLARQYHPDVNQGKEDKFKEINEAYEVLGDAKKRQMYDNLGSNWRHGQGFEGAQGFDPSAYGYGGGTGFGGQGFGGFQGNFQGSGFSDFFDLLFGQMNQMNMGQGGMGGVGYSQFEDLFSQAGGSGRRRAQATPPVLDIEQALSLDLEEVARGVSKKVKLTHNGQTVTVTIPRGVKQGAKIRLAGQGQQAQGRKGDAYLIVRFNHHPRFDWEGEHLVYEAQVPVYDLVLGGEVKVPNLAGSGSLTLTIPAGTQPGKLMRLKGQGLPVKSGQGDLMVRIRVLIPAHPAEAEKRLYEQLRRLAEQ